MLVASIHLWHQVTGDNRCVNQHRGNHHTTQLAKLKSVLCYFNQIANNQCDLKGLVTISRNIVPDDELPTIKDWKISNHDLCTVVVKSSSTVDYSDQVCTLQVKEYW